MTHHYTGGRMSTGKHNFTIKQGSTFRKPLQWIAGGSPVDMTGWSARMQIRPEVDSEIVIVELTTENGGITIEPLEGKITLYISAESTAALSFEEAVYDIELEAPDGFVTRIVEGKVKLSPEVTREGSEPPVVGNEPLVVETAAEQGPPGPAGIDGAAVSNKPKNRLTLEADGFYVSDDLSLDPLAYYILAKN